MSRTILHIDSSARTKGSVTRDLSADIVGRLGGKVIRRDLAHSLPHITADWVDANFTPADQRSKTQSDLLVLSDSLIDEVRAADTIVIGAPIYNFAIPASLKAWIDLVCRAGETFRYTESGPVGLMKDKRAIVALASGGTPLGSDFDFASAYLRHVLTFIGIADVQIVAADQLATDAEGSLAKVRAEVTRLAA